MSVSRGLRLPGAGNSFANTPDNAKYTPATSIEMRVVAAADDWTPASTQVIVAHSAIFSDVAWSLQVVASGQLQLSWAEPPGTVGITKTATLTPAATNRFFRGLGFRLTLATGDVTFLHSPDGFTWIEFQTDTSAPATSVHNSAQPLQVGGGGGLLFAGIVRQFELRVDNKIVADPRFDEQPPGTTTFDDSRGNKWTLGSAASIEALTSFAPTTDQILDLDGVHRRTDAFRFELCDRDLRPIGELHPDRAGSVPVIENNIGAATSRRLTGFRLIPSEADDVNTIRDRLRVYMVLQNGVEYRLGTFLWAEASEPERSWGSQQDADLVDFTYILDQEVTQAWGWSKGTTIFNIVMLLVQRAGFGLDDLAASNEETGTVLTNPMSWQPGSTWLRIITDLGNILGFAPPWFDRDGLLHFETAPDPAVASPTVPAYEAGGRIVADSIVRKDDIVSAANDFAVFDSGTDRMVLGRYQVPAEAPHSYPNRGYRVGKVESVQGLQWYSQANKAAYNLAVRAGRAFEVLSFASTADPRHDTYDVVPALGETWLEESWRLECRSGGLHQHVMRRTSYAVG